MTWTYLRSADDGIYRRDRGVLQQLAHTGEWVDASFAYPWLFEGYFVEIPAEDAKPVGPRFRLTRDSVYPTTGGAFTYALKTGLLVRVEP